MNKKREKEYECKIDRKEERKKEKTQNEVRTSFVFSTKAASSGE